MYIAKTVQKGWRSSKKKKKCRSEWKRTNGTCKREREKEGITWQHSSVHGHRNGDFVERNLVEKNFHVFHRINGHSSHAHISNNTWMVRIITAKREKKEKKKKHSIERK
jgi:hypothetical protein